MLYPLRLGNYVILRHPKSERIYIGEVLDIFAQAQSSRYNSLAAANGTPGLSALAVRVYWVPNMNIDTVSLFDHTHILQC